MDRSELYRNIRIWEYRKLKKPHWENTIWIEIVDTIGQKKKVGDTLKKWLHVLYTVWYEDIVELTGSILMAYKSMNK